MPVRSAVLNPVMRALSGDPVNGRWLLTGIAGRGSSAIVYRAFDLVTEQLVAIKAMSDSRWRGSARTARREFIDLARLRHPNLVETYERGFAETGPLPPGSGFFTMELLESPVFPCRIGDPLGLARLAVGLLSGLDFVHSHGLVHRDVKPSNVLVSAGPREGAERYKLADLGMASVPAREGARGICGTLHYAAPEVIAGGRIDRRSDLYSLGVLLFEAATGGLPFDAADPAAVLEWHLGGASGADGPARALPPTLARVVGRLLSTRPEARFQRAAEAREEILDALPDAACRDADAADVEAGEPPLTGREAEMKVVRRWLRLAAPTGGRLGVSGPSGFGLSRIAREADLIGRAEGWSVHASRCRDDDTPFLPLYRPLREILLTRCKARTDFRRGIHPRLQEREILALMGGLPRWGNDVASPADDLGPLSAAVAAFLTLNAPPRPMLLILDDFDRAGAEVQSVVDRILALSPQRSCRIMIVTTTHEDAPPLGRDPGGSRFASERRRLGSSLESAERLERRRPGARSYSGGGPASLPRRRGGPPAGSDNRVARLAIGPLSMDASRILLESLPGTSRLDAAEREAIVGAAAGRPAGLVRLARSAAGRQRMLFPPICEPAARAWVR